MIADVEAEVALVQRQLGVAWETDCPVLPQELVRIHAD